MVSTPSRITSPHGTDYLSPVEEPLGNRSPNQHLLPLTAQVNSNDQLTIGGVAVSELVKTYGSPLYILDEESLRAACRQYREALKRYYPGEATVLYASKAWNCLAICAIAGSEGLGIDVASGGELYTALQAGVAADRIYFHGNNKSATELAEALDVGSHVVVDNWLELETLAQLSGAQGKTVPILIRITPGIECHTHEYIRTGHIDSKFGFDPNQIEAVLKEIAQQPSLDFQGFHAHIGSQIFELEPHKDLPGVMVQWFLKAKEIGLSPSVLNVGGGLGIRYTEDDDPPSIDAWVKQVCTAMVAACKNAQIAPPHLICEPGRSLVGSSCITAYTVGSRKAIPDMRTYIAVDGGMSDNARPITYQALYRPVAVDRMAQPCTETVTVAGKHCESGDILIQQAQLPPLQSGDILAILATGAYNYSMASNYNRVTRPAAVLVREGQGQVIIERETYQDLVSCDRLPDRLKSIS
ncbi:MAG: diaminopimelate decarboxylase [Roseofilum sp. SBFL]|uniref:diaminopimelate decarboxylase n=1 Tax=unclassified Roseofilum TaxID=2620099 RepID=UPI001B12F6E0|nr:MULTISPECIES: diaminopimelate decarboxylase [unclassified Roseofilum]MBP0013023.1 diaminopimelate decarboxylase [Roseofilum sp. SID3]MBP0026302.1 diaminopimelate decarboxylase [Roseofilum sp. SID2]MBP0039627.1 diaminopimelate decarboxylase [Roseofilum sp. SID1]MBP0044182.1 diaminopimelate decarboxylase [Roseofilum sp. SBFL]